MTSGLRPHSNPRLITIGHWLFLCGVFVMVSGDGPSATIRVDSWPTPAPFLSWPWLYLVLCGAGFASVAAGGGLRPRTPDAVRFLLPALASLLGAFLLSVLLSKVHATSLVAFLAVAGIVGACWMAALLLEDETVASRVWPALAIAALLLSARVVLWRLDEGLNVVAFQIFNNAWVGKLQLAWVFNIVAPLILTRCLQESRWRAVLYAAAWAGSGIATYLLYSRMGTIVFALTTITVCVMNRAYWRKWLLVMAAAALLGAVPIVRGLDTSRLIISTMFEATRNPGVDVRLAVWRDSLRLFRNHPIAGAGLGTFDIVAYGVPGTTAEPRFFRNGWHAHNVYLHLLAETGLPGLLAWCYLWFVILRRLARAWFQSGGRGRLDAAGALCSVVAFLVLSMTEVLIGARVHASLRMNLMLGLVIVLVMTSLARPAEAAASPRAGG